MWQPLQVPPGVGRWLNFADRLDPVALDADLANDFTPSDKVTDHRIKNPYRLDPRAGGHTLRRAILATRRCVTPSGNRCPGSVPPSCQLNRFLRVSPYDPT